MPSVSLDVTSPAKPSGVRLASVPLNVTATLRNVSAGWSLAWTVTPKFVVNGNSALSAAVAVAQNQSSLILPVPALSAQGPYETFLITATVSSAGLSHSTSVSVTIGSLPLVSVDGPSRVQSTPSRSALLTTSIVYEGYGVGAPAISYSWQQLVGPTLSLSNRCVPANPLSCASVLSLPALSLSANNEYTFRVRAWVTAAPWANGTANVTVSVLPSLLAAVVANGSRAWSEADVLLLDGTASYDPDLLTPNTTMPLKLTGSPYTFLWGCSSQLQVGSNTPTPCSNLLSNISDARVSVAAFSLVVGHVYRFSLQVSDSRVSNRTSSTAITVTPVAASSPIPLIRADLLPAVLASTAALTVVGQMLRSTSAQATACGLVLSWDVFSSPSGTPVNLTAPGTASVFRSADRQTSTLIIASGTLQAGASYVLQLTANCTSTRAGNGSSSAQQTVVVASPPRGGSCSVDRTQGRAAVDLFTVSCTGWTTSSSRLVYTYAFKSRVSGSE